MMSPASPAANSPEAGTGQTWFKIYEQTPQYENGQLVFVEPAISSSWDLNVTADTVEQVERHEVQDDLRGFMEADGEDVWDGSDNDDPHSTLSDEV